MGFKGKMKCEGVYICHFNYTKYVFQIKLI